jgi:hypothetical protein
VQLAIQMQDDLVRIEIRCASIYDVMAIYDTVNATGRDGCICC